MLQALENTLRVIGWNPALARLGMYALLLIALGAAFNIKIRI